MQYLVSFLYSIPNTFIVAPLKILYFQGPSLFGWGGWAGLPMEDICAQFTQVSADLWKNQRDHCAALIDRKFRAILVVVGCATYFAALYKLIYYMCFRYFFLRPLLRELKDVLNEGKSLYIKDIETDQKLKVV